MKTAGELVPFAPPIGSVWERPHMKDQATVVKVENGMVHYTVDPDTMKSNTGLYGQSIPIWQEQMKRSLWRRISRLFAQTRGLEGGVEDEVTKIARAHGFKIGAALKLTGIVVSDYQGWTNWDTWHVKLMMDNEQPTYNASRKLIERGCTEQQFIDWAVRTIIGPYNRQQIADAQEWNDIPEHDRLDHNWEDLKQKIDYDNNEKNRNLADGLLGGPDVGDTEPTLMHPEQVNWYEIIESIKEENEENRRYEAGEPPTWQQTPPNPDTGNSGMTLPEGWTARVASEWDELLAQPITDPEETKSDPFFRIDNPYDFKWAFNNKTGQAHVWRVGAGGDGRPAHKTMYEQQGWQKQDLALGQARYRPAQRRLDGSVVEPAELRILYYPHTTTLVPEAVISWLTKLFPEAMVHCMEFSPPGMFG